MIKGSCDYLNWSSAVSYRTTPASPRYTGTAAPADYQGPHN